MTTKELIERAKEARKRAYAPYSGFKVGVALETSDGKVFTGANVENASYGLTVCAERVAVFKAVTEGHLSFRRIAIVAGETDDIHPPCGACLQVLAEFSPDITVISANTKGHYKIWRLRDLMPDIFRGDFLKKERQEK